MIGKKYITIFLLSAVFFVVYNEVVVLPYQVWDPSGFVSRESMMLRDPFINLVIIFVSFGSMCVGSYAYIIYQEVNVIALNGLTDLSTMRDTTKGGSG